VATEEIADGHATFAFGLDFAQKQGAGAAADEDASRAGAQDLAGGAGMAGILGGLEYLQFSWDTRTVLKKGEGAGPWIHGADMAGDFLARAVPPDFAILAPELFCVGGKGVVLRDARGGAGLEEGERLGKGGGGGGGQAIVEAASGLVAMDRDPADEEDVAGIEPLIHEHDGDAGFPVA